MSGEKIVYDQYKIAILVNRIVRYSGFSRINTRINVDMSEGEVQVNLIVYPNFPIILEILSNFMDNYRNVTGNGNGNPNREGTMILVLPRIYGFGGPQI